MQDTEQKNINTTENLGLIEKIKGRKCLFIVKFK